MDMETGLLLLSCPLSEAGVWLWWPRLPKAARGGGRALWGLADGRQAGTGSPHIIGSRQELGGVAASSSVPALAARQGSCLMGFSSQML